MPVQFRLTAPIFNSTHGGRQLAQRSLQNSACSGQHRDAVPIFNNCGVAKWEGTGLISRSIEWVRFPPPLPIFILGCSIIQEVTCFASGRARCKAVAVHHFKSREG